MADERGFEEFLRARLPHLLRVGRALTCDDRAAGTLVAHALGPVLARWDESSAYTAEDDVRRAMVGRALRGPDAPTPPDEAFPERDTETWAALARLAPNQRAAMTLLLHEELTDVQAAELMRCSSPAVQSLLDEALDGLEPARVLRALEEPVTLDENALVAAVHQGADRSRRRRAWVVAGIAAVVVAALSTGGIVAALGGGNTEPVGLPEPAFALAATDPDQVWVVTDGPDCVDCSTLWVGDGTSKGWTERFSFDRPALVAELLIADNGEDGVAWFGRDWLQATHDGGESWVIPGVDLSDTNVDVKIAGTKIWALLHSPAEAHLYTSEIGTDEWQEFAGFQGVVDRYALVPLEDDMFLMSYHADGSTALTRADPSAVRHPIPCDHTPLPPRAARSVLWLTCSEDDGLVHVLRSGDGATWTEVYASDATVPGSYPVSDDTTFVVTREGGRLISQGTAEDVSLGVEAGELITDGGFVTEKVGFLVTEAGRVLRTDDGGHSWREIG